jgi:sugar-specific transcriptional regulator TrmB
MRLQKFLVKAKKILFSLYYYFLRREMEKKEILQTLQSLGLNEYESKVYVTLSLLGPAKASEISKQSEVPRSKIYEVLESLIEKQMVEVSQEKPKMFRAIAPEVAIKTMLNAKEEEFSILKKKAKAIIKELKVLPGEEKLAEGIWEQESGKSIDVLNKLAEMIGRARKYVIDITRDFSTSQTLRDAIKACLKRNVKVRVICMGINEDNYYRAKWYFDQKIPIRVFEAKVHPRILVVDGREVAIRLDRNPLAKKFAFKSIWSSEPSFVSVIDSYMKNLWKMARPIKLNSLDWV